MVTVAIETLQEKVLDGHVVNREEALELFHGTQLNDLGAIADTLKTRSKGDKIATYLIDRNINYTNVCVTYCKFCAFYREPGDTSEGYVNEADKIIHKVAEAKALGATQILLQGGHHPDLKMDWYVDMLSKVKQAHPDMTLHAFSPPELVHFSSVFGMPVIDILKEFRKAGNGFHARRRGRDFGGPDPQGNRAPQGIDGRMAGRHARPAFPWHAFHRHHDVRPCGNY